MRMSEKELLDEIFELALQNDMNYLGVNAIRSCSFAGKTECGKQRSF